MRAAWAELLAIKTAGRAREMAIIDVSGTVLERVKRYSRVASLEVTATSRTSIELKVKNVRALRLFLSPALFDLRKEIVVSVSGRTRRFDPQPSAETLIRNYRRDGDPERLFAAQIDLRL